MMMMMMVLGSYSYRIYRNHQREGQIKNQKLITSLESINPKPKKITFEDPQDRPSLQITKISLRSEGASEESTTQSSQIRSMEEIDEGSRMMMMDEGCRVGTFEDRVHIPNRVRGNSERSTRPSFGDHLHRSSSTELHPISSESIKRQELSISDHHHHQQSLDHFSDTPSQSSRVLYSDPTYSRSQPLIAFKNRQGHTRLHSDLRLHSKFIENTLRSDHIPQTLDPSNLQALTSSSSSLTFLQTLSSSSQDLESRTFETLPRSQPASSSSIHHDLSNASPSPLNIQEEEEDGWAWRQ